MEISAPVSAQAPIGLLLLSEIRLNYNGDLLGGAAETAEATGGLVLDFYTVVNSKYLFRNS